ncbi:AAA family ATPase [Staphylococcus warneri]|uniref:AAA family ATPase n=2 Tax=Staphylococcus TaxID=1279 RepID=UPI002929D4DB|nr:AAA family ATPase [Staphylococcus warneri]MDU9351974.1 AAA family ATPase [Staphylococcus warneri]
MGRIIKVGDGFLKTTLSKAIINAQYGDTILIENINISKETMTSFEIPKGMNIKITSADNTNKTLYGFNFLIKGSLSLSNVNFNNDNNTVVFAIENGSLILENIYFQHFYNVFEKGPIYNENGHLYIKNSITFCPHYSFNGTNVIENSTIYGGTRSSQSKWHISNCLMYNNYLRYQWTIKEKSEMHIIDSKTIAHTNLCPKDDTSPIISINSNSFLYLDNTYMDFNDPSDSKKKLLIQVTNNGMVKTNNSEVTKLGLGSGATLKGNSLKSSSIAITDNSTINIGKLTLGNKFNERMYFRLHNSKGEVQELNSNLKNVELYLLNSNLAIHNNIPNNFKVLLQDKNSSIKSSQEINTINLFEDKKTTEKPKKIVIKESSNETEKSVEEKESNPIEKLNNLIGLSNAKKQAKDFINVHVVNEIKKKKGIRVGDNSLHSVYKGNPGTGKTTVARLIAQILSQEKVIKKDLLVEVTRQDLVAGFVGQTAIKTEKILKSALGGVLFIDEAYTLYSKSENDYGIEAIETILKFMEDNRDNIMIIFAGYPKEMDELMRINPGLESRIKNEIIFDDYTIAELCLIGKTLLTEYEFNKDVYEDKLKEVFKKQRINSNARFVRNFNDEIIKNQSNRLFEEDVIETEYNIIRDIDITSI